MSNLTKKEAEEIRKKLELTQDSFALALGINLRTYSNYLTKNSMPVWIGKLINAYDKYPDLINQ